MKKMIRILTIAILGGMILLQACSKKNHDPSPISLVSLTSGSADLDGATAPTGVSVSSPIVATFSTAVDAATATSTNITLTRDFDKAVAPISVATVGNVVTITPTGDLSGGATYVVSFSGVKSTGALALTPFTRSFTTGGTFTPDGQISHWSFNDTAEDELGVNNPSASGVVAVEYKAGRNAAAGKAAYFNGTTSIIEIPNGDAMMNAEYSLSYWLNLDSSNLNSDGVHAKGNFVMGVGNFNGMQLEFSNIEEWFKWAQMYERANDSSGLDNNYDGKGGIQKTGNDTSIVVSVTKAAADIKAAFGATAWNHFVYTFSGSTKVTSIYWNGVLVYQRDFNLNQDVQDPGGKLFYGVKAMALKDPGVEPGADDYYDNTWAFGFWESRASTFPSWGPSYRYSDPNANHYKGGLDDVRLFHRSLSAAEITLMYNSEK